MENQRPKPEALDAPPWPCNAVERSYVAWLAALESGLIECESRGASRYGVAKDGQTIGTSREASYSYAFHSPRRLNVSAGRTHTRPHRGDRK